jgi:hypothetical protein
VRRFNNNLLSTSRRPVPAGTRSLTSSAPERRRSMSLPMAGCGKSRRSPTPIARRSHRRRLTRSFTGKIARLTSRSCRLPPANLADTSVKAATKPGVVARIRPSPVCVDAATQPPHGRSRRREPAQPRKATTRCPTGRNNEVFQVPVPKDFVPRGCMRRQAKALVIHHSADGGGG